MNSFRLGLACVITLGGAALAGACSASPDDAVATVEQMNTADAAAGDADVDADVDADADAGADATGADASADGDAGTDAGEPDVVPYTRAEVQALVDARCTGCHGGAGGLFLEPDFEAQTIGVPSTQLPSMARIAPGDRDASYLFLKVTGAHTAAGGAGRTMPVGGALSDEEIARLGAYIDAL